MKPGPTHDHAEHGMHMSYEMPPTTAAAHMGHDRHAGRSVAMFRDKFWLTLILTLPVVLWSTEVQHWLGYTAPTFSGSQYIPAFLGTIVFLYGGSVFIRGAWGELTDRRPGMMTLFCLGIVVAFAASLVKNRLALERSRDLDVVIFDKTGTLTRRAPTLSGVAAVSGAGKEEVLNLAVSVEADAEHPLAKAIVSGANRRGANPLQGSNFEAMPGSGARANVNGQSVSVGGPHLLSELKVVLPLELEKTTTAWASEGQTVLSVVVDGRVIGTLAVEDEVRPESAQAVKELHDLGVHVAMITGDSQAVADSVAKRIGIDEVEAQVLPADKASTVARFQAGARK